MTKGILYLVPNVLSDNNIELVIPSKTIEIISEIKFFIVEDIRNARRYLKKLNQNIVIDNLVFEVYNEHNISTDNKSLLQACIDGHNVALLSDAGMPAVADPGTEVVRQAHNLNIEVIPLTGPSSILLSIAASGLCGQNFAFIGYLPVKNPQRQTSIKNIERRAKSENQTQIFIETPYRNIQLFEQLLQSCFNETELCVAINLTATDQFIKTKTIAEWKKTDIPDMNKKTAIFLIR